MDLHKLSRRPWAPCYRLRTVGQVFILLAGISGANIHICTGTNIWSAQSSLPSFSGQTGKVLTTDGIGVQWSSLAGDLTGVLANLRVERIQGRAVSNAEPQNGQVLLWDQTQQNWLPATLPSATGEGILVKSAASPVGTRSILRFEAGTGMVLQLADTGSEISIQPMIDTAVVATRALLQSVESQQCVSTGTQDQTFRCSLNPVLLSYVNGMIVFWRPDKAADGVASTLEIEALGPKPITRADGVEAPRAGDYITGRMYPLWYDGTSFRMLTDSRSLTPLSCASSATVAQEFSCATTPGLAQYFSGQLVFWQPDIAAQGADVSLNIDTLGARPVKLSDGSSNPEKGDLEAGRSYPLWYDGAAFRVLANSRPAVPTFAERPDCTASLRGRLWLLPGAESAKDDLSVCAKDETEVYAWRTLYE